MEFVTLSSKLTISRLINSLISTALAMWMNW